MVSGARMKAKDGEVWSGKQRLHPEVICGGYSLKIQGLTGDLREYWVRLRASVHPSWAGCCACEVESWASCHCRLIFSHGTLESESVFHGPQDSWLG